MLVLVLHCAGHGVALCWSWCCTVLVMVLHCVGLGVALCWSWCCTVLVLVLHCVGLGVALCWSWCCTVLVLVLHCVGHGVAPCWSWCCTVLVLVLHCAGLGVADLEKIPEAPGEGGLADLQQGEGSEVTDLGMAMEAPTEGAGGSEQKAEQELGDGQCSLSSSLFHFSDSVRLPVHLSISGIAHCLCVSVCLCPFFPLSLFLSLCVSLCHFVCLSVSLLLSLFVSASLSHPTPILCSPPPPRPLILCVCLSLPPFYVWFSVCLISLYSVTMLPSTVARKRSRSFCQNCRWQVTAKHAYILYVALHEVTWCMVVWCIQNLRQDGSSFMWH